MQKKYIIPRFHDIAVVVVSYGPLALTVRQLTILLIGGLIAVNLWPVLSWFALVPAGLVVLPFGWLSIARRPLEFWLLVLVRYWLNPKRYENKPLP